MKKILPLALVFLFTTLCFAADEKKIIEEQPFRFFGEKKFVVGIINRADQSQIPRSKGEYIYKYMLILDEGFGWPMFAKFLPGKEIKALDDGQRYLLLGFDKHYFIHPLIEENPGLDFLKRFAAGELGVFEIEQAITVEENKLVINIEAPEVLSEDNFIINVKVKNVLGVALQDSAIAIDYRGFFLLDRQDQFIKPGIFSPGEEKTFTFHFNGRHSSAEAGTKVDFAINFGGYGLDKEKIKPLYASVKQSYQMVHAWHKINHP